MPKSTLLYILIFSALMPSMASAVQNSKSSDVGVFEPKLASPEEYSETFSLIADLGAKGYLQAQMMISNLGPGDHHGLCKILFIRADGKSKLLSQRFDEDDWEYKKSDTLQSEFCSFSNASATSDASSTSNDGRFRFSWKFKNSHGTITSPTKARRFQPPGSSIRPKKGVYDYDILIPHALGTLAFKVGGQEIQQEAPIFVDHSRSTTRPKDLACGWFRMRSLTNSSARLLLWRLKPDCKSGEGWLWLPPAAPEKIVSLETSKTPETPDADGKVQTTIRTSSTHHTITVSKRLFRFAPVEEYGFLGRLAMPFVGNPITQTWRGKIHAQGTKAQSRAIIEVTCDEDNTTWTPCSGL